MAKSKKVDFGEIKSRVAFTYYVSDVYCMEDVERFLAKCEGTYRMVDFRPPIMGDLVIVPNNEEVSVARLKGPLSLPHIVVVEKEKEISK